MRYCSKCKMNVENELKRCPLCGEILDLVEIEVVRDYPSRFAKKRRVPIRKLIVFMAMVIISYSFIIGIFHDFNWNWVFIIVCSTLYLSVSVIIGLRVKKKYWTKYFDACLWWNCICRYFRLFTWLSRVVIEFCVSIGTDGRNICLYTVNYFKTKAFYRFCKLSVTAWRYWIVFINALLF